MPTGVMGNEIAIRLLTRPGRRGARRGAQPRRAVRARRHGRAVGRPAAADRGRGRPDSLPIPPGRRAYVREATLPVGRARRRAGEHPQPRRRNRFHGRGESCDFSRPPRGRACASTWTARGSGTRRSRSGVPPRALAEGADTVMVMPVEGPVRAGGLAAVSRVARRDSRGADACASSWAAACGRSASGRRGSRGDRDHDRPTGRGPRARARCWPGAGRSRASTSSPVRTNIVVVRRRDARRDPCRRGPARPRRARATAMDARTLRFDDAPRRLPCRLRACGAAAGDPARRSAGCEARPGRAGGARARRAGRRRRHLRRGHRVGRGPARLATALVEAGDFGCGHLVEQPQDDPRRAAPPAAARTSRALRESVRERAALLRIAPRLVRPLPFLVARPTATARAGREAFAARPRGERPADRSTATGACRPSAACRAAGCSRATRCSRRLPGRPTERPHRRRRSGTTPRSRARERLLLAFPARRGRRGRGAGEPRARSWRFCASGGRVSGRARPRRRDRGRRSTCAARVVVNAAGSGAARLAGSGRMPRLACRSCAP